MHGYNFPYKFIRDLMCYALTQSLVFLFSACLGISPQKMTSSWEIDLRLYAMGCENAKILWPL